jgi:hypothetical protein
MARLVQADDEDSIPFTHSTTLLKFPRNYIIKLKNWGLSEVQRLARQAQGNHPIGTAG